MSIAGEIQDALVQAPPSAEVTEALLDLAPYCDDVALDRLIDAALASAMTLKDTVAYETLLEQLAPPDSGCASAALLSLAASMTEPAIRARCLAVLAEHRGDEMCDTLLACACGFSEPAHFEQVLSVLTPYLDQSDLTDMLRHALRQAQTLEADQRLRHLGPYLAFAGAEEVPDLLQIVARIDNARLRAAAFELLSNKGTPVLRDAADAALAADHRALEHLEDDKTDVARRQQATLQLFLDSSDPRETPIYEVIPLLKHVPAGQLDAVMARISRIYHPDDTMDCCLALYRSQPDTEKAKLAEAVQTCAGDLWSSDFPKHEIQWRVIGALVEVMPDLTPEQTLRVLLTYGPEFPTDRYTELLAACMPALDQGADVCNPHGHLDDLLADTQLRGEHTLQVLFGFPEAGPKHWSDPLGKDVQQVDLDRICNGYIRTPEWSISSGYDDIAGLVALIASRLPAHLLEQIQTATNLFPGSARARCQIALTKVWPKDTRADILRSAVDTLRALPEVERANLMAAGIDGLEADVVAELHADPGTISDPAARLKVLRALAAQAPEYNTAAVQTDIAEAIARLPRPVALAEIAESLRQEQLKQDTTFFSCLTADFFEVSNWWR